ncbi:MAG: MOSC domain-containing protein [Saprospiraceae bacterium]
MNIKSVIATLPQIGHLQWIGIRPDKGAVQSLTSTKVSEEDGIEGDHYSKKGGKRQVTLIQAEHLTAVGNMLGKTDSIDPTLTRRNLVISGINLLAFKNRQFQIGKEVILEMTGLCHPCTKMERNLGAGGYNAMRGHGGITAKVIQGGIIEVGDQVKLIEDK